MKPRLNVHVAYELFDKVALMAKRPGVTKAAVVEAALMGFFSKEFDDQHDGALIRRLDRMTRQYDRLERNLSIATETLALFIRFFLTVTPPLPNADQDAARATRRALLEEASEYGHLLLPAHFPPPYSICRVGRKADVFEVLMAD